MCGVIGYFSPKRMLPTVGARAAANAIKHRGPDDEGFVIESSGDLLPLKGEDTISELSHLTDLASVMASHLLLGHRRLSIIDLSVRGHQPLVIEGGRYAIAFNGEIYNYLELKSHLQDLGHTFDSDSDTEVALKAWVEWGNCAFSKFNGMWAMAIWDQNKRRLLLCRDRFGVKPLYVAHKNGALYFASEIKALRSWDGLSFTPNRESIDKYLGKSLINCDTTTFWDGIEELAPGTWIELCGDGRLNQGKYWNLTLHEKQYKNGEAEELFSYLFEDSLRLRMRSDVEVGTLLSGGLDSNIIVGGLFKNNLVNARQFNSFSAVFDEAQYSEERYIDQAVLQYPLTVHKIKPSPEQLQKDFVELLHTIEEPFRSLSVYSQFKIYQHIRSKTKVKVVLNGQGADEMFGGYSGHYYYLFIELISSGQIGRFIDELIRFQRGRDVSFTSVAIGLIAALKNTRLGRDGLNVKLLEEVQYSPLPEYLKYDDRTSMSAGIEARAPFMDYRLVEFAFSLPNSYKIFNFKNKVIERDYASNCVSPDVVNRKDKMGFISPQATWQRAQLKPWFDESFARIRHHENYFAGPKVVALYEKYQAGGLKDWERIWRHFCLYQWLRFYGFE